MKEDPEVFRRAPQKIEHGYAQAAAGLVVSPEEARKRLATMRAAHLVKKASV